MIAISFRLIAEFLQSSFLSFTGRDWPGRTPPHIASSSDAWFENIQATVKGNAVKKDILMWRKRQIAYPDYTGMYSCKRLRETWSERATKRKISNHGKESEMKRWMWRSEASKQQACVKHSNLILIHSPIKREATFFPTRKGGMMRLISDTQHVQFTGSGSPPSLIYKRE